MRNRSLAFLVLGLGCLSTVGCGETATPVVETKAEVATQRDETDVRLRNPFNDPEKGSAGKPAKAKK